MAISHWPSAERPREKLIKRGANALSDAELLAIFLRTGVAAIGRCGRGLKVGLGFLAQVGRYDAGLGQLLDHHLGRGTNVFGGAHLAFQVLGAEEMPEQMGRAVHPFDVDHGQIRLLLLP